MPKLSIEDKKFLIDQLRKERIATALEAILLQIIIFSIFIFLNMTGIGSKFSVSIGLVYVLLFAVTLIYSLLSFFKNKNKLKKILKTEKMID
jgi:RsiW-degrading membrane proteinase PrsW (M82 family)